MANMNSHDYARALQETGDYLLSKPKFETYTQQAYIYLGHYYEKKSFLAAAKALGSLEKNYKENNYLEVKKELPLGARVYFNIIRDKVCRLVKAAEYECEPLLSPEEETSIATAE